MGNSRMCTYMAMQFFNSNLEFLNKHYLNLCCCIISGIRKRSQRNILKPVKCIRNAVNMAQSPISPQNSTLSLFCFHDQCQSQSYN